MNVKEYQELYDLGGISGNETLVRKYVRKHLEKTSNEIVQDKWGSVYAIHRGSSEGPVIMVDGHMDEVGVMITGITNDGLLKIMAIGGINVDVMISQKLDVIIDEITKIRGIIASIPPHLTRGQQAPQLTFDDLRLDIGCSSKAEVESLGIKLGMQAVFVNDFSFTYNNKRLLSKAIDDRFGCMMALEISKELMNLEHPNTVICGCSVQEEVGLRGAQVSSKMFNPDLFIAVDVSPSTPGVQGELGEGFLVRYYDPGCIMHKGIRKYIEDLANKYNIKYQYYTSRGGTNAATAQYAPNTISCTIGLPARYIHSTCAMADLSDMEEIKKIVLEMIKAFDIKALEEVKENA